ncbi:MAG: SurA N-terminal domain-containing protein [Piscirickettsiaceae bacterium]|nr:SurA N-terminal domain-containing protein [Piscirickettsiaceae bacterium]
MLHFIRERAQGWVAWFIVGLISIPFALWGVNSYLTGPSDAVTASVNGDPIKQVEFQRAFQQYRDRMRESMGERFDPEMFEAMAVKQSVLDGLIEQRLLLAANNSLGQQVSDTAVNNLIQSNPAFQQEGQFNPERYRLTLARVGLSPASYEAQFRQDLLAQELTNNIQQSALVSSFSIDNILRLEKQTRDIAYGVISAQSLLDQVNIPDDDVQAYYDANQVNYMAPERVAIDYIELSVAELSKAVAVDEELLQQFYVDNQDQFLGPEQRQASHILIEGDDAESLVMITTIKQRLDDGEDFSVLAAALSHDTGSAKDGGDLGLFQRGVMDTAFENAAFALSVGDISDPVQTEFGYHLIKLTAIQLPEGKSFADARQDIESSYRYQQAEELFYEQAELLADLSYENPDNLDIAAEELLLEIKTTEAFTRDGGIGIASHKKLVKAAFSEDVLTNELNSAVIELNKTHLLVLHKKKHILASQLPFESISPAIREQLKFEQARYKARKQGMATLTQLQAGELTTALFSDQDWHEAQSYGRASSDLSQQVLQKAFSLGRPGSEAIFTGFTASNGNYIVVKVTSVTDGDPSEATEEERDGLQSYLSRTNGSSELQAFIETLRTDADIEVFTKYLR